MNDPDRWQKGNDAYLTAALGWLRLCLARHAGPVPAPSEPPPTKRVSDAEIAQAAKDMAAAEAIDPPPALILLSRRLGLSRFEQQTLLLCAAMELDTRIGALCAHVQADHNRPYPIFALGLTLLEDPAWDALSPERPLRYWRLIEINQPGAQPLTTSTLRADERIVNYIKGLNYLERPAGPALGPTRGDGRWACIAPLTTVIGRGHRAALAPGGSNATSPHHPVTGAGYT
jgi:hypothetical protein